ncbi:MAG: DUF473 domain-containing protein [Methanomicrobiaceae archaeon]|uniref:DUF473 domain-containing protein n=1 Tax=hydrocarbon metagenome TaxID=938273 RepID=A0A0W8FIT6_9ZZZZ|nr:DUF473 domain-containing protein [Methanomicrobiaceae archaeon]MDD5420241.1 DUF473 domain-containing protein [Methanomicrobiaceae archaeon]
MKYTALTGISPSVIAELKMGKPRTLELQSAHNIISLTDSSPGDCIFMTSIDLEDLSSGDPGIVVSLNAININMKRVVEYLNPLYFEERERMSARIQVRYLDSARVKDVEGQSWGKPTRVELVRSACYHAG